MFREILVFTYQVLKIIILFNTSYMPQFRTGSIKYKQLRESLIK